MGNVSKIDVPRNMQQRNNKQYNVVSDNSPYSTPNISQNNSMNVDFASNKTPTLKQRQSRSRDNDNKQHRKNNYNRPQPAMPYNRSQSNNQYNNAPPQQQQNNNYNRPNVDHTNHSNPYSNNKQNEYSNIKQKTQNYNDHKMGQQAPNNMNNI